MGSSTDLELLARAVRNPCRLVLGPTSTSAGFPHGGVSLGFVRDVEVVWRADYAPIRDAASGRVIEVDEKGVVFPEVYLLVEGPSWDEDVLQATFSRTTAPSSAPFTQPPEAPVGGDLHPRVVPAWAPILLAARDPQHKSAYFRRPIPLLSLRSAIQISQRFRAGLPVRFVPTPTPDYLTTPDWQVARLENIAL